MRSVRPFVIDELSLVEAAEDEGFDVSDQIEVGKFLKRKVSPSPQRLGDDPVERFFQVNELIEKATAQWEERNAQALERGEEPLPTMLPLIRLKVTNSIHASFRN